MRLTVFFVLCASCESLQGRRVTIAGADATLLIPQNWEHQEAAKFSEGQAMLEAHSASEPSVHLEVFVTHTGRLEDLVTQTLTDAATLEKKGELKVRDVTQMSIHRGPFAGLRVVHQLQLGGKIDATQIADDLWQPGTGITLLVVGPKEKITMLQPELDELLGSLQATPKKIARPQPPDMVSSASQAAARSLLEGPHEEIILRQ